MSAKLAAKAIRAELKKAFPSIKFSVTSESFSMGDAVRISYTDGVMTSKVEKIAKKYQEGSVNSMEDIYEYDNINRNLPQAKYVTVNRDFSEAAKAGVGEGAQELAVIEGVSVEIATRRILVSINL